MEGIVAKRRNSLYWFGKKTKDWIKCKVMQSTDCIICGYNWTSKHTISLILGIYHGTDLVYKGHVSPVGSRLLQEYKFNIINSSPFTRIWSSSDVGKTIWFAPEQVCIIESMPTDKGGFRQPVFKGIRDDKLPEECQDE